MGSGRSSITMGWCVQELNPIQVKILLEMVQILALRPRLFLALLHRAWAMRLKVAHSTVSFLKIILFDAPRCSAQSTIVRSLWLGASSGATRRGQQQGCLSSRGVFPLKCSLALQPA